ncbi:hypothetical protein [Deinococcus grandis]|nr:hypothetical protein [Deinococcus grandis]
MKMQKRKKPIWPWIVAVAAGVAIVNTVRTGGDGTTDQPPVTMIDPVATFPEIFIDTARQYFNRGIIYSISAPEQGKGIIDFRNNPEYLGTGDKVNKVMAIESARLFREIKELNDLSLTIPSAGKTYRLQVTRKQMDSHYGTKLADLSMETWRNFFLERYDTKQARAEFVAKHVKVSEP